MPRGIAAINEIWRERQKAVQRAQEDPTYGGHRHQGYDPNQSRVPAGHPDGGQWTTGEDGGVSSTRVIVNSDGSAIRSEVNASDPSIPWDERHTVRLPNGHEFTFEKFGRTQTVYDGEGVPIGQTVLTDEGPEPQAVIEPAFYRGRFRLGAPILRPGVIAESNEAAVALFSALSATNNPRSTAVLDFRAQDFRRGENAPHTVLNVGQLTENEVEKACKRYTKTKRFLDEAVDKAHEEGSFQRGPAIFGTRVHKILKDKINDKDDPNWRSEVSLENVLPDDPRLNDSEFIDLLRHNEIPPVKSSYGQRNTIRSDVIDYKEETRTMCMPDVKTGKERFTMSRMKAMVLGGLLKFPHAERFIIFEMRPTKMPVRR